MFPLFMFSISLSRLKALKSTPFVVGDFGVKCKQDYFIAFVRLVHRRSTTKYLLIFFIHTHSSSVEYILFRF